MKNILVVLSVALATHAEYNGQNIDGQEFDCTAFSYSTGKYYEVTVEFDVDEDIITFDHGGTIRLQLDSEIIEDPTAVEAFDYKRAVYWDLEVHGLE